VFENAMQVEGNVNLAQNLNSREWVVLKMLWKALTYLCGSRTPWVELHTFPGKKEEVSNLSLLYYLEAPRKEEVGAKAQL
jgi:hypothetical protein